MVKELAAAKAFKSDIESEKAKKSISDAFAEQVEKGLVKDDQCINLTIGLLDLDGAENRSFDESSLAFMSLVSSMKKNGLIQPVVFNFNKREGKFVLVAGHRRVAAARAIGWTKIMAKYQSDGRKNTEVRFDENVARENLDPLDYCKMLVKVKDEYKYNTSQLSDKLGKSRTFISACLKIASWHRTQHIFIKENELKITNLVKIAEKKNPDIKDELKKLTEPADKKKKNSEVENKKLGLENTNTPLYQRICSFYSNRDIPKGRQSKFTNLASQFNKLNEKPEDLSLLKDFLSVLLTEQNSHK